jgi:hypothetical protein
MQFMQWYYSKNGTQLGPISEADIRAKITSGEIAASDLIWKEGMGDWQPAGSVKEFSVSVIAPSGLPQAQNSPYLPPMASYPAHGGPEIPNYLWQSIAVTLLCCLPFGIVGIVYAAKVDGLKAVGNFPAAAEASANAKKWCKIALISWAVLFVLYLIFVVVVVIAAPKH